MIIIFWDFLMFYEILLSPLVKRIVIISSIHGIYELPHKLPNGLGEIRQRGVMGSCPVMSSRINADTSLRNLYFFTGTWDHSFKPHKRKATKRSHDVNKKRYPSCAISSFLVAATFLMSWKLIKLLLRKWFMFLFNYLSIRLILSESFW